MPIHPDNRKRYPSDWKLRSRFVRFIRARGHCELCGAKHGEPHPITGSKVVLTTAHWYDNAPENASLMNLKAACQRCHVLHDVPTRRKRRLERIEGYNGQLKLEL